MILGCVEIWWTMIIMYHMGEKCQLNGLHLRYMKMLCKADHIAILNLVVMIIWCHFVLGYLLQEVFHSQ